MTRLLNTYQARICCNLLSHLQQKVHMTVRRIPQTIDCPWTYDAAREHGARYVRSEGGFLL